MLCWKGKYIVGITHVPAEAHFNIRYEYDNNAVIAHDFFADDPYPGVLTIEASESSDPTPVADFETALRAFLQTVGVSNVALSRVAQLSWWNTNAAFYEVTIPTVTVTDDGSETVVLVGRGNDYENGDGDMLVSFRSDEGLDYLVQIGDEGYYLMTNGDVTDVGPSEQGYEATVIVIVCNDANVNVPSDNYKLIFWAKDNNLLNATAIHGIDIYDTSGSGSMDQIEDIQVIAGKKVVTYASDDWFLLEDESWIDDPGMFILDGTGAFTVEYTSGQFLEILGGGSVNAGNTSDRMKCFNGLMLYLAGVITQAPTAFPI